MLTSVLHGNMYIHTKTHTHTYICTHAPMLTEIPLKKVNDIKQGKLSELRCEEMGQ